MSHPVPRHVQRTSSKTATGNRADLIREVGPDGRAWRSLAAAPFHQCVDCERSAGIRSDPTFDSREHDLHSVGVIRKGTTNHSQRSSIDIMKNATSQDFAPIAVVLQNKLGDKSLVENKRLTSRNGLFLVTNCRRWV